MSLRLTFKASTGEFEEAFKELYVPGAKAAMGAIREAAEIVKRDMRGDIARAGFSKRWQNALRVDVYPKGRTFGGGSLGSYSMNAAVWVYHKIPYAGVFEDGATIRGRPKLWIPLSGTPKKAGGKRTTPKSMIGIVGPNVLFPIVKGSKTYLAARVRMSKAKAEQNRPKVTIGMLRGAAKIGPLPKSQHGRGVLKSVPLFVGIDSVDIKKRLNFRKICNDTAGRLAELYLKNFEGNR